ncbi:hypothetical protein [uncultured Robinsoniella sp.]|uniref:hypothetical protein n=1 Tax=uncultured Robinsoniella sp. TaxID=904190 RepID=UPI00374E4A17
MGFGSKAERNGKCKCDSQEWYIFEVRETKSHDVVVTVSCTHCKSLWDTRAINSDILSLMTENQAQWYKSVLEDKVKMQKSHLDNVNRQIEELQKERNKSCAVINKLQEKIMTMKQ